MSTPNHTNPQRKPSWLKTKIPGGKQYAALKSLMQRSSLHTICQSGLCPNMAECWAAGTATFMILGEICTRSCRFCATRTGKPLPPDPAEPQKVAEAVASLGLKHVVITSVDRDDLPDQGASVWAETIRTVKQCNPSTTIEVLIPDFSGRQEWIQTVAEAGPDIIAHNLETVQRLTPKVRSKADYQTSLKVLDIIQKTGVRSKSGIMAGLGETIEEITQTMDDLRQVECQVITIGQYLQPTKEHLPVDRYYTPKEFQELERMALAKGFLHVESAPLVRSSYHAEKHVAQ
jgi:lipoyl synthase